MASSSSQPIIMEETIVVCLACGDPFTPDGLAAGVVPILFSCGHTVCTDCAEAAALSLSCYPHQWACGLCFDGWSDSGGCVNAGLIALVHGVKGSGESPSTIDDLQSEEAPSFPSPLDFNALSGSAFTAITSTLADLDRINAARHSCSTDSSVRRQDSLQMSICYFLVYFLFAIV